MHKDNASESLHADKVILANMSRQEVVELLEDAGFACYDDENVDDLKGALWGCVLDGDIELGSGI